MYQDFRGYLGYLEEQGKLLRVPRVVSPRFGIAAGIRKISDNDGPALLFENISGYPGWRVAGGVYATQKLIALALGLPVAAGEMQITRRYLEIQDKCIKPRLVATGPVKEIIIKGDDVDLSKLPICTHSEKDVGPYLTSGVEIARDVKDGFQNVSIHRRRQVSKNVTGLRASYRQHLGMMIERAHEMGQGLPVATVLGADPWLTIASQIKTPFGVDETEVAGALRGEPLEVVKAETIDVDVPAHAEVVIEGVTVPGELVDCGPFGEYPGNYITMLGEPRVKAWAVRVTAITMRKDAIYHAMLTGMPQTEDQALARWSLAANAYRAVSQVADVREINVTAAGGGYHHFIVSIKKHGEMDARSVIYAINGARNFARLIIVVDDDINVFNPADVEYAVATRMLPDKDIVIMPPVSRGLGEPSAFEKISARWSIDATMPLKDKEWYRKIRVPGVDDVDYV